MSMRTRKKIGYEVDRTGVIRIGNALPLEQAHKLVLEKILAKVEVNETGCWIWKGWVNPQWGYGFMCFRNKSWRVHCLMWTIGNGEIPKGMVIRHRCDTPACCNPAHLLIGTHKDNVHDRMRRGRDHKSNLTHCPQGHEYAGEHLQVDSKGYRHCRTCARIKQRIAAGWPVEMARTAPVTPKGHRVHTLG
jgi:hypothetical protein